MSLPGSPRVYAGDDHRDGIGEFVAKIDPQNALGSGGALSNAEKAEILGYDPGEAALVDLRAFVGETKRRLPTFTKVSQFKDSLRGLAKVLNAMAE